VTALPDLEHALRDIVRDVVREELRAVLGERDARGGGGEKGYLSIARAAEFADVAPGTLRRWIRTGRLPVRRAGRVYRVARTELEAFLERNGASAEVAAKARALVRRVA
jgi:excisionase family DNA binding protein